MNTKNVFQQRKKKKKMNKFKDKTGFYNNKDELKHFSIIHHSLLSH